MQIDSLISDMIKTASYEENASSMIRCSTASDEATGNFRSTTTASRGASSAASALRPSPKTKC